MRKIFVLLICILCLFGCGKKVENKPILNDILTYEEVKKMITEDNAILVDVRTKEEYDKFHLDDAINIPFDSILDLNKKDDVIIVYCASGNRSSIAYKTLTEAGYKKVYDFGSINNAHLDNYE